MIKSMIIASSRKKRYSFFLFRWTCIRSFIGLRTIRAITFPVTVREECAKAQKNTTPTWFSHRSRWRLSTVACALKGRGVTNRLSMPERCFKDFFRSAFSMPPNSGWYILYGVSKEESNLAQRSAGLDITSGHSTWRCRSQPRLLALKWYWPEETPERRTISTKHRSMRMTLSFHDKM